MATPMEHHTEPHRLMATPGDRILEGAATTPVEAVVVAEVVVEDETHTVNLTALVTTPHEVVEDRAAVAAETAAEAVVEVEVAEEEVEVVVAEVEVVGEEAEDRQTPGISPRCSWMLGPTTVVDTWTTLEFSMELRDMSGWPGITSSTTSSTTKLT